MRYFNGRSGAAAEQAGNEGRKKQQQAGQGAGPVGAAFLQC